MINYVVTTSDGAHHDIEAEDPAHAARLVLRNVAQGVYRNPDAPNHDVTVVDVRREYPDAWQEKS